MTKIKGKKANKIIAEMMKEGVITSPRDLTGDDDPTLLFYVLIESFKKFLESDSVFGTPADNLKIRGLFVKFIKLLGPFLLKNQKVISDEYVPDGSPVIYVMNHFFKDDVLSTVLAIKEHAHLFMASLPALYNTIDGVLAYLMGTSVSNRKVPETNKDGVEKVVTTIKLGKSTIICPEGVHNKTPDELILHLYRGAVLVQERTKAPIVTVIHYSEDSLDKKKPIYTSIGKPMFYHNKSNVFYTSIKDLKNIASGEVDLTKYRCYNSRDKYASSFNTELLRNVMASAYVENMLQYYEDSEEDKEHVFEQTDGTTIISYYDDPESILEYYGISPGYGALNEAWERRLDEYRKSIPYYDTDIEKSAHLVPRFTFSYLSKKLNDEYDLMSEQYNIFIPEMTDEDKKEMLQDLGLTENEISDKDLYDYYCIRYWEEAQRLGIDGIFMTPIQDCQVLKRDRFTSLSLQSIV